MGKKSDFLQCYKCDKNYHSSCLEPPMIHKFVNRFKWQCPNCKTCQVCNVKDSLLSKCSTCDRTFHEKCYKVCSVNGKAFCGDCLTCKNCSRILPILTIANQNDLLQVKGYRVCEDCWKYYKNVIIMYIFIIETLLSKMFADI
jgi:hypothetical protein